MPSTNLGRVAVKPCGEYNPETLYKRLSLVTHEGSSYVSRKDVQGIAPPDPEYWQLSAREGRQGESFAIKGHAYATVEELRAAVTDAKEGDNYNVGTAPPYHIYRRTDREAPDDWEDQGILQGANGEDGATFTPAVDEDGNLSFSNDRDLPNPQTVNIRGPQGAPGKDAPQIDDEHINSTNPWSSERTALDALRPYAHQVGNQGVHQLTAKQVGGAARNIRFVATDKYKTGDTFTLDGAPVAALMPDGNELSDGFFVKGAVVLAFLNEETLYFVGGGASANVPITIMLQAIGGGSGDCTGVDVLVTDAEYGTQLDSFTYDGPHTITLPIATRYRVHVGKLWEYVAPEDAVFTAVAGAPHTVVMTYKYGTRLGFSRSKINSHRTDRIEYMFDAVGKNPVTVNLSSGAFDLGDWEDFFNQMFRPVMLKTSGDVDYELNRDDQGYRADNSGVSDVANTAYDGNAMLEVGGAYKWVKRWEDAVNEYVVFCNTQFDSDYHAYAHTNAAGVVKDAFYWGLYKGTLVGGKLRSIATGAVNVNTTRQQEITYATANGKGYYTGYKSGWDFLADILTLLAKDDNGQAVYGAGRSLASNTAAIAVGSLKNKGAFWGSSNGTSDVKALYVEGIWGNVWEALAGCILDGTKGIKVKMTPPYNLTGDGYESTGIVPTGTSGGFVDTESVSELGYVPKSANGSETTYMCDGLWFNTAQVDYALCGGNWTDAGKCGPRCLNLSHLASRTYASIGARLSYVPE